MEEFKQQLGAMENKMDKVAQDYPDLSPDSRRECQEKLDETLKTLQKIRKDLADADKDDPDARIVQVLGLKGQHAVTSDFKVSFEKANEQMRQDERKWIPGHFNVDTEFNYTVDVEFKLKPVESQTFVTFNHVRDACHVLGMKEFHLVIKGNGGMQNFSVKFVKPAQNSATRALFRKIGGLVDRIKEIEKELKELGAVRDCGVPKPNPNIFLDKSFFEQGLLAWKRARAAGQSLDHHSYAPLKYRKPVDMAKLQARMKTLYDEECDALIELREYQVKGVVFDFE